MAKKDKNVEAQAIDIAGQTPGEVKAIPVPSRITTQGEAISLVKNEYKVPDNIQVVIVTEDRSVFWQANEGSAVNHAQRNNLKLFRISCQDLVE